MLTAEPGFRVEGRIVRAVAIDVPVAGTVVAGPKPAQGASTTDFSASSAAATSLSLPLALVFALGGGLLLNLMPCVFPVLSLKALALVTSGAHDRAAVRREGVAFAAGVIVAFVMLGAAIVGLRAAGEQLGWGFQLQSPAVVSALALLFFVMALNLSGVFEFGTLLPSALASWSHSNRNANAFASGLLAVAIASPCTAPFMGAALGYALAENANVTFAVFVALGIGMALPYVALAWFPAWRRVLPRPGAWMVQLKQLLAFPLYATVAWLVWVLGAQVGNDAVMRIGATLVLVAFALWAWRMWRGGGRFAWATAAIIGAVVGAAIAWPLLGADRDRLAAADARTGVASNDGWEPYSAQRVAELVAQGRAGIHRFHRRMVRHVPGQQAARADGCGCARCVRARRRRVAARRLDAPRSGDHARALGPWPQRRAGLRPLSQGRRAAAAARSAATAGAHRRDHRLVAARVARPKQLCLSPFNRGANHDRQR